MDEWTMTMAATGVGVAVVLMGMVATRRRHHAPMGEVALLPWNSIMLAGMVAAVFGAVHLLTLWRGV